MQAVLLHFLDLNLASLQLFAHQSLRSRLGLFNLALNSLHFVQLQQFLPVIENAVHAYLWVLGNCEVFSACLGDQKAGLCVDYH